MTDTRPSSHFLVAIFVLLPALSFAESPITVRIHDTRDFGYGMGDIISRHVSVSAEAPYRLAREHLPAPGPLLPWLDVRNINLTERPVGGATDYEIALTYQVFHSSKQAEVLTIPAVPLRFHDGRRSLDASIPEWQFGYAPLIPSRLRDEEINLRPSDEGKSIQFDAETWRLSALAGAGLLLVLYLAWFYDWLPLFYRHAGPFTRAARYIHPLTRNRFNPEAYRSAFQHFHQALNESAGETVFAGKLSDFYARQPRFTPLRAQTEQFFEHSRHLFFGDASGIEETFPLAELDRLCRKYRDIERSLK